MATLSLTNREKRVMDSLNRLAGERGTATGKSISDQSRLPLGIVHAVLEGLCKKKATTIAMIGYKLHKDVTVDVWGNFHHRSDGRARNRG